MNRIYEKMYSFGRKWLLPFILVVFQERNKRKKYYESIKQSFFCVEFTHSKLKLNYFHNNHFNSIIFVSNFQFNFEKAYLQLLN